jgi:hypothetical protein
LRGWMYVPVHLLLDALSWHATRLNGYRLASIRFN